MQTSRTWTSLSDMALSWPGRQPCHGVKLGLLEWLVTGTDLNRSARTGLESRWHVRHIRARAGGSSRPGPGPREQPTWTVTWLLRENWPIITLKNTQIKLKTFWIPCTPSKSPLDICKKNPIWRKYFNHISTSLYQSYFNEIFGENIFQRVWRIKDVEIC